MDIKETFNKITSKIKEKSVKHPKMNAKLSTAGKVVIALAVVALFYVLLWGATVNSSLYKYLEAAVLKFNKDYANAVVIYDELGDYRLSQEKSYKLHHILGEEYLQDKDYVSAMEEFKLCGEDDKAYYSYALGMYCFENGSYDAAIEQLYGLNLYDSAEIIQESKYYLAIESIKSCDKEQALGLLDGMKLDYAPSDFSVGELKRIISKNEKYMDYNGIWTIDSGLVGAYEAVGDGCKGWEYDIFAAEDTQIMFSTVFDDALNVKATLSVTYPYYAAYSRDGDAQAMFTSYKTVTKRFYQDELSEQIVFDDNTNIVFVEDGGVFSFHAEGAQIVPGDENAQVVLNNDMPQEDLENDGTRQIYTVRETTIVFNTLQR